MITPHALRRRQTARTQSRSRSLRADYADLAPLSLVGPNDDRYVVNTQCAAPHSGDQPHPTAVLPRGALAAILHNMRGLVRRANQPGCIGYDSLMSCC